MMRDQRLWLLLAVAAGVRLVLMPLPDPFDADLTTFWLPWMAHGAQHGLADLYTHGLPPVNYPPLYLTLLAGLGKLYGVVVPGFGYTPLQSVLIKLPAVLADLAITVLLYAAAVRVTRSRAAGDASAALSMTAAHDRTASGDASAALSMTGTHDLTTQDWFPLLAAGLWALNPAIIYVSAFWAQVDSIHTLWMLAALLAALARRWGWSGVLMGLALLTKLHAIVLLPLLFVLALRHSWRALAWGALGLGATLALGLLPLALSGVLDRVLLVYSGAVGAYPKLSVNAFNGWFIIQTVSMQWLGREILDTARVAGPITLRWVGLALLGAYTAALLVLLWRNLQPGRRALGGEAPAARSWLGARAQLLVFFAAGMLVFGFFSLPTEMHERYGLPALAFLALPAAARRRDLWPYLLLTAVFSLNLLRVLPWGPGIFRLLQSIPGDRLLLSLASVGLFIWLTALYVAAARRRSADGRAAL